MRRLDGHRLLRGLGPHEVEQAAREGGEVEVFGLELDGAGEVEKGADDTVETDDFLGDDIQLRLCLGQLRQDAGAEQFEAEGDGVEGVLDFVGDAAGEAADGGEAGAEVELVFDDAASHGIAEPEEGGALGEGVEADQEASGAGLFERCAGEQGGGEQGSDRPLRRKKVVDAEAGDLCAGEAEKPLGGLAGDDEAALAVEEEDRLLQPLDHAFNAVAQLAGPFLGAAELLAEQAEFFLNGGELAGGRRFGDGVRFAAADAVNGLADALEREQGDLGGERRDGDGEQEEGQGSERGAADFGQDGIAQEDGRDEDLDLKYDVAAGRISRQFDA